MLDIVASLTHHKLKYHNPQANLAIINVDFEGAKIIYKRSSEMSRILLMNPEVENMYSCEQTLQNKHTEMFKSSKQKKKIP